MEINFDKINPVVKSWEKSRKAEQIKNFFKKTYFILDIKLQFW